MRYEGARGQFDKSKGGMLEVLPDIQKDDEDEAGHHDESALDSPPITESTLKVGRPKDPTVKDVSY